MRRVSAQLGALLVLAGCSGQNAAVDAQTARPGKAVLILAVGEPDAQSSLQLSPYDPARHVLTSTPFSGFDTFDLSDVSDQGFVWKRVDPGTYVFASYTPESMGAVFCQADAGVYCATWPEALSGVVLRGCVRARARSGCLLARQWKDEGRRTEPLFRRHSACAYGYDETTTQSLWVLYGSISLSSSRSVDGLEDTVFSPASFKAGYTLYGTRICGGYGRQ